MKIDFKNINIKEIKKAKLDFTDKCYLCGHDFIPIYKYQTMSVDCPNCNNELNYLIR